MAKRSSKNGSETDPLGTDTLFTLPLGEFTSARNALAGRLRKAGRPDDAAKVKSLPKPSIAAWVVNRLFWQHGKAVAALLAAGDTFRDAQARQLAGEKADLRGALEGRRVELAALMKLAAGQLEGSEHAVTPDLLRRISTTLEALSAYGSEAGAPLAGHLTDDLSPPGFETLASLVPRAMNESPDWTDGPSKVLRFKGVRHKGPKDNRSDEEVKAALVLAATAAVREAERVLAETRQQAEDAERELRGAAAHAKAAESIRLDLAERLDKATAVSEAARLKARQVAGDAEQAAQRVEDADRELDRAREALDGLNTAVDSP